jgi:hypothetical protein
VYIKHSEIGVLHVPLFLLSSSPKTSAFLAEFIARNLA